MLHGNFDMLSKVMIFHVFMITLGIFIAVAWFINRKR